ncbi:MAG: hypothetical protein IKB34_08175 [Clostridia bacterium]|nr:hypothetical protein [Clostridia bacterium]
MAIRMRFLHYPDNKKMSAFCQELTAGYENCKFDKVPPAYPSERERFTVIFIKAGKDPANDLTMFCGGLTKDRTQNVLYFMDAPDATVNSLVEMTEKAGAKVCDTVKIKYPGLFGGISEDTKKTVTEAVAKYYAELNN